MRPSTAGRKASLLIINEGEPAVHAGQAAQVRAGPNPLNYWSALTDATSVKDGKLHLKVT
jgi:hypothetical protein